jgi:hypothetical protein
VGLRRRHPPAAAPGVVWRGTVEAHRPDVVIDEMVEHWLVSRPPENPPGLVDEARIAGARRRP